MEKHDKIKTLIVYKNKCKIQTIEQEIQMDLKTIYEVLECDTCDVITRKINNKSFLFFVDDEGWLKNKPITMISIDAYEALVGNVMIANFDEDGGTCSLTSSDIDMIRRFFLANGFMYSIGQIHNKFCVE